MMPFATYKKDESLAIDLMPEGWLQKVVNVIAHLKRVLILDLNKGKSVKASSDYRVWNYIEEKERPIVNWFGVLFVSDRNE